MEIECTSKRARHRHKSKLATRSGAPLISWNFYLIPRPISLIFLSISYYSRYRNSHKRNTNRTSNSLVTRERIREVKSEEHNLTEREINN